MTETVTELIDAGGDITNTLTAGERAKFQECEESIQQHIKGFLATGYALAEIMNQRLYRESYKTFEKYCKKEWDIGKAYAYRQISGYEAIQNLYASSLQHGETSTMGDKIEIEPTTALGALVEIVENELGQKAELTTVSDPPDDRPRIILPQNERQIRPLTKLSPDDQVKAWDIVLEQLNQGKKLTSYLITQAAKEIKGEEVKKKIQKKKIAVQSTRLVSKIFATQYQVLLDIISAEKKAGWRQSSKKEVIKHLEEMITISEMKD